MDQKTDLNGVAEDSNHQQQRTRMHDGSGPVQVKRRGHGPGTYGDRGQFEPG